MEVGSESPTQTPAIAVELEGFNGSFRATIPGEKLEDDWAEARLWGPRILAPVSVRISADSAHDEENRMLREELQVARGFAEKANQENGELLVEKDAWLARDAELQASLAEALRREAHALEMLEKERAELRQARLDRLRVANDGVALRLQVEACLSRVNALAEPAYVLAKFTPENLRDDMRQVLAGLLELQTALSASSPAPAAPEGPKTPVAAPEPPRSCDRMGCQKQAVIWRCVDHEGVVVKPAAPEAKTPECGKVAVVCGKDAGHEPDEFCDGKPEAKTPERCGADHPENSVVCCNLPAGHGGDHGALQTLGDRTLSWPASPAPAREAADPDIHGVWRCEDCGEMRDLNPAWRWTGERWEHSHGQAGHIAARYFGPREALLCACLGDPSYARTKIRDRALEEAAQGCEDYAKGARDRSAWEWPTSDRATGLIGAAEDLARLIRELKSKPTTEAPSTEVQR